MKSLGLLQQNPDRDILKPIRDSFAETIILKLKQFERYVPKGKNADLTGAYIEALVRHYICGWLGRRKFLTGTFYGAHTRQGIGAPPLQIDGIVYDPEKGPLTLVQGDFAVVDPRFCSNVIEIKKSLSGKASSVRKFHERLEYIHTSYMFQVHHAHVMGVVIHDSNPEKHSRITNKHLQGGGVAAFNYSYGGLCPIFILFKETNGEYEPFYPAIDALIRAIYQNKETGFDNLDDTDTRLPHGCVRVRKTG
jgi:hypothetical protein